MNPIQDSSLLGEVHGPVTALSGYQKPKFKLAKHSEWEQNFIRKAGADEVAARATALFHDIRDAFKYLRKDLSFAVDGAVGSIKSPDFDVNLSLNQDPEEAERYVLTTQVTSFHRPEILEDERFLEVFSNSCDSFVIDLSTPIDLAAKIDELEQIDSFAKALDYDPACTYFILRLTSLDLELRVTSTRVICKAVLKRDLKSLIKHTIQALDQLTRSSVFLLSERK
jgi:hypothetical protein